MPGHRRGPLHRRRQGRRLPRPAHAHPGRPSVRPDRRRPEFIASAVAEWCHLNGVGSMLIDTGSPWQDAWIESFNSRLRDEFLKGWQFDGLLEAQVLIEVWRIDYNDH